MGVVLFAPATAIEAVSNIPVWMSVLLMSVVATLYTSVVSVTDISAPKCYFNYSHSPKIITWYVGRIGRPPSYGCDLIFQTGIFPPLGLHGACTLIFETGILPPP